MTQHIYGRFWRRLLAMMVDGVILTLIISTLFITGIIVFGIGVAFPLSGDLPEWSSGLFIKFLVLFWITASIIKMIYFVYFIGTTGQTPGKMFMGLRVVQQNGDPMTFGLAFLRWVGYIISGLCFYLGFLWILFDYRKQGWHDKIAGTVVICV
ncbi:MAG: RDD family protein [Syntrophales bacterium]|jgi:uncharacterized RDD family membrane protein YckC